MAVSNYNYTYASSLGIPTQVKYVDYYLVAGGGGGGRPSTPPGWGRNATAGGASCLYNVMGAGCLLYTSPSPRDKRQYRMPSSA